MAHNETRPLTPPQLAEAEEKARETAVGILDAVTAEVSTALQNGGSVTPNMLRQLKAIREKLEPSVT